MEPDLSRAEVEHAVMMAGGGMRIRNSDPEIETIYPLADWIRNRQRFGGKVYVRTIVVIEGWAEAPPQP